MADPASPRRGLGKGLSALLGEGAARAAGTGPGAAQAGRGTQSLPLEALEPSPFQPRRRFDEAALAELVKSVESRGILEPILVRPHPETPGRFQIVAGERRWRAAGRAELTSVPVLVREFSDAEALEVAIVENVQRADLDAIEEAQGYRALIDRFAHTQDEVAALIGKSRSHVANTLRLLNLPEPVQALVAEGKLTAGQVRPLIGHPEALRLARDIAARGLSAREAEALAKIKPGRAVARAVKTAVADADTRAAARTLSDALGCTVTITHGAKGGAVTIRYTTLEQFDDIERRLLKRR